MVPDTFYSFLLLLWPSGQILYNLADNYDDLIFTVL